MSAVKKDKQSPAGIGHNIDGLYVEVRDALAELNELDKKSKEINDKKAAIRSRLESKGLIKKGLAAARSFFNLSPEDRKAFDQTYVIVRDAGGMALKGAQLDLNLDQKKATSAEAAAPKEANDAN